MAAAEQEILDARRAYPAAQAIMEGVPVRRVGGWVDVGWHGTETSPEFGSFAVVRASGPLVDLIGETLKITVDQQPERVTFAYCWERADVPADLSVCRRPFLDLGLLAHEAIRCIVEVVG